MDEDPDSSPNRMNKSSLLSSGDLLKSSLLDEISKKLNSKRRYDYSIKDYIKSYVPFFKNRSKSEFSILNERLR